MAKSNGAAPTAALTVGAVRKRLAANGYAVTSATWPFGWTLGQYPELFVEPSPAHLISEHPAAVLCRGAEPLVALLVQPVDDTELGGRIRAMLDEHGLTGGPHRIGSDGVTLWPLRYAGYQMTGKAALDGAVTFLQATVFGRGTECPTLIGLDGAWQGSLLDTPAAKLPEVSDEQISAVLRDVSAQSRQLEKERRPAPQPSKYGWIGQ